MESSRLVLGVVPTPLERTALGTARTALWVKRDDLISPIYGGNKARKLEYILGDARARGKSRLVTAGSAGSHHVLATTIFGTREGFGVEAALVPQARSDHALFVLRASLAQGLVATKVTSYSKVPAYVMRRWGTDAYYVQVGGSSALGTFAYVQAARELAAQVRAGEMPEPDAIYVTLGTGGTVAGLALGAALEGLRTRVVAVAVVDPVALFARAARHLVKRVARLVAVDATNAARASALARIEIEPRFLGAGYGRTTEAALGAIARAEVESTLKIDPIYTGKTLAAALARVERGDLKTILFWHTYANAPLAPLVRAGDERFIEPYLSLFE